VVITYRVGSVEVDAVARDICDAGRDLQGGRVRCGKTAKLQLSALGGARTHAYYFATPTIFREQSVLFARTRLDAFRGTNVDGFLHLAQGTASAP
jgi:hypothetical protein